MVKRLSFFYSLRISFWRAETEFLLERLIADSRYGPVYKKVQGLYLYAVFCIEDILKNFRKPQSVGLRPLCMAEKSACF